MTSSIQASAGQFGSRRSGFGRNYGLWTPFIWLVAGMRDMKRIPVSSLFFGLLVFVVSVVLIAGLFGLGLAYIVLPALAGFLVMGPAIALGLYEASRRLSAGQSVSLSDMVLVKARSPGQILFVGLLLMLLLMLWLRAAFLLYALFFGMLPFSGFDRILLTVFTTPEGWGLLLVGTAVGAIFAAFAFAISVFSIPMLLNERKDALTAMAVSMSIAWANKPVVLVWGVIVVGLFVLSLLTGLLGLIVVFPLLGHSSWHAYVAMRDLGD